MMLWRLLRQMIVQGRGRLAVALVALVSGATVSAALLNLEFDAERKITRELRTLGPNVMVRTAASPGAADDSAAVFGGEALDTLLATPTGGGAGQVSAMVPSLYVIVRAGSDTSLVLSGTWLDAFPRLAPWWRVDGAWVTDRNNAGVCLIGHQAAARLQLRPGSSLELRYANRSAQLRVAGIVSAGGPEDDQVFT